MKKMKFICVAMAAMLCLGLAPAASAAGSQLTITNPNNIGGYRDPKGYWKNGLYYPNGYWYDNIYYSYDTNVGYWKDGVYYSYGDTNSAVNVIPYDTRPTVVTGPGYWQNGIFYPYSYNYYNNGYWSNGVYYPTNYTSNSSGYWQNGVFYPYAYYPGNTYPYGYYPYNYYTPGYYSPTMNATLGGVSVPNIKLTQAVANNKNIGFTMRGTTVAYANSDLAPVAGQTAVTLDFSETVGRAHDQSLVLTMAAVGSGVADKDQQAVMLNGYVKHFEAAKEQGVQSLAIADKDRDMIATIRINDTLISNLKKAYEVNGADLQTNRFILQVAPVSSDYLSSDVSAALERVKVNSEVYSVKAFIVINDRKVDISDQLGKVNLRIKATSQDRSLLAYYNGSKFELTEKGTFVLDQGNNQASAYGDVAIGSTVAIVKVKAK